MIEWVLAVAGLLLALIPMLTFLKNRESFKFRSAPTPSDSPTKRISVLIPARDEQRNIESTLRSILNCSHVDLEVIVLDDHSTDATKSLCDEMASQDSRLRCIASEPLPSGWNGKQYACYQLSRLAKFETILFLDADVRLQSDSLWKVDQYRQENDVSLLSIFPEQETCTLLEKMFIPLIHFLLLGYLPIDRMRRSRHPAYAAGCGQFFFTTKQEYNQAGTHKAIARTRHDGVMLPKAFRAAGLSTDVIDGTELARCRMYDGAREVVRGILKNAVEGIAHPVRIVPFTLLLLGSSLLPWIALAMSMANERRIAAIVSMLAIVAVHIPRVIGAMTMRQSSIGVVLHSAAVTLFTLLQWVALIMHLCGLQVQWRGRIES